MKRKKNPKRKISAKDEKSWRKLYFNMKNSKFKSLEEEYRQRQKRLKKFFASKRLKGAGRRSLWNRESI